MIFATIATLAVSGCVGAEDELPLAPEQATGSAQVQEITLSNCRGFQAQSIEEATIQSTFAPPEGWSSAGRPLIGYRILIAECERASSAAGQVWENVTWGYEAHTNVSSEGKQNWSGSFSGMLAPLARLGHEGPFTSLGWTEGGAGIDALLALEVPPSSGPVAASLHSEYGSLTIEALAYVSDAPVSRGAFTYRFVIDGPNDVFLDMTRDLHDVGIIEGCRATATGEFQLPNPLAPILPSRPMQSCSIFVDSTFHLVRGVVE